jgi:HlyD family secretion protein
MVAPSPVQARQTKAQFARPEDYLSYELGQAVQELPPLYTRLMAGSISLLLFSTIAWAHFSQVDEVAVANGELIPSVQVRPVRSLTAGTIRAIKVKEGDRIQQGDVLLERDPSLPQAEVDRLASSAKLIKEDLARLEAERSGTGTAGTDLQDQLLSSRIKDFEAKRTTAIAEANRQLAAMNSAKVRLNRLRENLASAKINQSNAETNLSNSRSIFAKSQTSLSIAQKRVSSIEQLLVPGAIPRLDYLDAQERLTRAQSEVTRAQDDITKAQDKITDAQDKVASLVKDIAGQEQEIRQAEQAYQAAVSEAKRVSSERQSEVLTTLTKRQEEQSNIEGQLNQAKKQRSLETITAPFSGTIYNIKVTQGPVQPQEELLSILPEGEELLLEVKVLNRDIGFIAPGMKTKVKMSTFPFQEFGTVEGEIVQVSPNAIVDKDLGLVFPTRIKLSKNSLIVRRQEVSFTPGMTAVGEIVTRKKSVLTFLIEPVTRRFSEAFSTR